VGNPSGGSSLSETTVGAILRSGTREPVALVGLADEVWHQLRAVVGELAAVVHADAALEFRERQHSVGPGREVAAVDTPQAPEDVHPRFVPEQTERLLGRHSLQLDAPVHRYVTFEYQYPLYFCSSSKGPAALSRAVPREIVPDVHDITVRETGGRRYRVFLVDDVPTLFDAGFADTTDALFEGIAAAGLTPERLVLTHADPDHVGGFDAVVDRYGVETHVPEGTELGTSHDADYRYGDGDTVGGFEAVHVPGHTADHHALVDETRGVLVAGDALSGADLRGFPEGYLLPHAAVYAADRRQAELSLDRLLNYEFDAALVYHGSSVTEGAREVLDRYVNFPGRPDEPVK